MCVIQNSRKKKIAEWMFQAIREYYMKKCIFPNDKHLEEVVESRCFVMTAKVYVDVLAVFSREGGINPYSVCLGRWT